MMYKTCLLGANLLICTRVRSPKILVVLVGVALFAVTMILTPSKHSTTFRWDNSTVKQWNRVNTLQNTTREKHNIINGSPSVLFETNDSSRSYESSFKSRILHEHAAGKLFANTYFIVLKRDNARAEHIKNLKLHVFPGATITWAIDGASYSMTAKIREWQRTQLLGSRLGGVMNPAKPTGKPKIACLMSHVYLWKQLAQELDNSTYYFIMEDDVSPAQDFHVRYPGVVQELRDLDWDWVYLAIHPTWRHGNKLSIPGKRFINKSPRMVGNAAYLLSKRGATKILSSIFPVTIPKDQVIRRMIQQGKLNAYIVKSELIHVIGQQGEGFHGQDESRRFKSNIWDH
eukprot:m.97071 g.97071  ORF g.97071 m.97071 type:complete len:344 (-) comp16683_c0_seq7:177-1208(-)